MPATVESLPNRRGVRSREAVLDAAERLMAEQGYDAATVARLVEEAGIPASSIYHYYGSKEGVLLAVMERGAARFFDALPEATERFGSQLQHLETLGGTVAETLAKHPDFLSLLVVMATQPRSAGDGDGDVEVVVLRVRETALERLRTQMAIAFQIDSEGEDADQLARFALAAFDGAFVAYRASANVTLAGALQHLPAALVGVRKSLAGR